MILNRCDGLIYCVTLPVFVIIFSLQCMLVIDYDWLLNSCANCSYSETRSISAKGHSYGDWIIDEEPTEDSEGSKHKECSNCGDIITEDIPEIEVHHHSYNESEKTEATCTSTGSITYTCDCGETYNEIIPLKSHTEGEWRTETEASCVTDGIKIKECIDCGAEIEGETDPSNRAFLSESKNSCLNMYYRWI